MLKFKSRKTLFKGHIIDLHLDRVENVRGECADFEVIHHPGGAVVVAINQFKQVCLIRQYRHVIQDWIWELPAGKLDHGEAPLTAAKRELHEEVGVYAQKWVDLNFIYSSPGVFNEKLYLYLAEDIEQVDTMHEAHELIEVHWVDFGDAYRYATSVNESNDIQISDAKSIIAIQRASVYLSQR